MVLAKDSTGFEREFRCEQWDSFPPSKCGWTLLFRDCRPDRISKNVGYPYANTDATPNFDVRARNGTSTDSEYYVTLGNEEGKEKAILIDNREIPMDDRQVHWNGGKTVFTDQKDTKNTPVVAQTIVHVISTESALCLEGITFAQMNNLPNKRAGMIVFVQDTFTDADGTININKHYGYDGTNWMAFY